VVFIVDSRGRGEARRQADSLKDIVKPMRVSMLGERARVPRGRDRGALLFMRQVVTHLADKLPVGIKGCNFFSGGEVIVQPVRGLVSRNPPDPAPQTPCP